MAFIRDSVLGACLRQVFNSQIFQYSHDRNHYTTQASGLSTPSEDEAGFEKGVQLCDWNGVNDPENPRNWKRSKKLLIEIGISCYAFVVYMSAPIWTPSEAQFKQEFATGYEYTALGLALFVYVLHHFSKNTS